MPDPNALADQVNHVLQVRPDAAVDNPEWEREGTYGYIYRRGHVLTRAQDEDRVSVVLTTYLNRFAGQNASARLDGEDGERAGSRVEVARILPGPRLLSFSSGLNQAQVSDPPVLRHRRVRGVLVRDL